MLNAFYILGTAVCFLLGIYFEVTNLMSDSMWIATLACVLILNLYLDTSKLLVAVGIVELTIICLVQISSTQDLVNVSIYAAEEAEAEVEEEEEEEEEEGEDEEESELEVLETPPEGMLIKQEVECDAYIKVEDADLIRNLKVTALVEQ